MPKKDKQKTADEPKAWEFVLVRDEKGNFLYYYKGKFYTYEEVTKLLSPREVKKLKKKEEVVEKKEEEEKPLEELPADKRELEQKFLREIAEKIIAELKITLTAPDKTKFINIIISRLRAIRKDIETKYILTASKSAGGLGLDNQKAEVVITTIKKYLPEVEKKRLELLRMEKPMEAAPAPLPPVEKPPAPPAPEIARKTLTGLDEKKPVVADVTKAPSLVGPIEELRTMDLVNLRRLGANKEEIISEIRERVNLLAEQSLQKKVQGITAWQQSPVYQMYLDLGYQSIKGNKPIENIINEKLTKGEKILTFEEFQAIMELNSKLQF